MRKPNPWQNISIASAISNSRTRRISAALGLATGAHDRAPVVEDPARLAGLPYWLAE